MKGPGSWLAGGFWPKKGGYRKLLGGKKVAAFCI